MDLSIKQNQFNKAIQLYNQKPIYKIFGFLISILNISMQIILLYKLRTYPLSFPLQLTALIIAYFLCDFINGLVHLYMDNNDNYESLAGPFIANFHLHHKTPRYIKRNIFLIYFIESGSKVWLVGYLGALLFTPVQSNFVYHLLVFIGVLSSIAEVSHYLCHTSNSRIVDFLAQYKLLLSKKHHATHHQKDNLNYAFLNGLSDPLLNWIAHKFFLGYKNRTDLHYQNYFPEKIKEK